MIKRYVIEVTYDTDTQEWEVGGRMADHSHFSCDMDDMELPDVVRAVLVDMVVDAT
jgi:hypothetical protein